ncbi:PriCT-2 domain-containing protein [Pedobacter sp. MC2016-05]|uniref:BT4734/BF3469 family protein n=1 Tax=Pedobacter sp. MC2016-05 TaxID=2994474 RepID=UPI002248029E|nr:BT4734/BF3469 family protein [Pedobacter sp. MC2016-05]MCX2473546.1 PriCT-2 domain-containing protein [Pedobacter sp. MC2016-05]
MYKFSFYKGGIKKTEPIRDFTIEEAVNMIKGDRYKEPVEALRATDDKARRTFLKSTLDYFTFSGIFKKRTEKGLIKHSNIICLDFDDVDVANAKNIIVATNFTLACFTSPSGTGVKALFRIDGAKHSESFAQAEVFFEQFGLVLDKSGKDIPRACFVSHDPEAYFNPKAALFKLNKKWENKAEEVNQTAENEKSEEKPKHVSASKAFEAKRNLERATYIVEQAEAKNIDLTGDYSDWQLLAFSLATFGEDGRSLFHRISKQYSEYNEKEAEEKFDNALTKGRFTTPGKFFTLARDYGLETKMPKTIAEKKEEADFRDHLDTDEEVDDLRKYGIYESGGTYWSMNEKFKKVEVSNFKMRIIYHVETSDDEAYRLIQIKNIFGYDVVIKMNTDDFVSIGSFKKLIARKGNFIFKGNDADLCRLQDKLQRDEVKTELVRQLGYYKRYNFYAFANGIFDCHLNEFKPIDELGIVEHYRLKDDEMIKMNFFIPAMSKMFLEKDDLYVSDKRFLLTENSHTFKTWANLFCRVYGTNGQMAIMFYIMALFSDIVFKAMDDRFPMLNVYGQKGTGKGTMIESMMKLFGLGQKQLMLGGASTVVGMMRKSGQYSNAFIWLDEYKNTLKTFYIESLKNLYDRIGYERGKKDNTFQTESTRIDSAVIVSGQEMPIVEEALFSRFILLITAKFSKSEAAGKLFHELKDMEADGLSNITVSLLKHRTMLNEKFKEVYKAEQRELRKAVNNAEVDERFINNYASLVAMCTLIKDVETLPFNVKEFRELCKKTLVDQYYVLKGTDSIGKFWSIIENLFYDGHLMEDRHFQIREAKLYIRIQDVYQMYSESMTKRKDPGALDEATLRNYLENDPKSFVERKKVSFGGSYRWCHTFKYPDLGIDLIKAQDKDELREKHRKAGVEFGEDENDSFKKPEAPIVQMEINGFGGITTEQDDKEVF